MKSLAIEHLPVIASAPSGVKKLRELILQLAVMGKLVPQDPNDEPAHSLLKRILEKKRSGTSSVSDPMIAKNNRGVRAAFEPPGSWVWTNLDEVAIVNPRNVVQDDVVASFVPMNLIGTTFSGQHEQQQRVWKEIKQGFTHFADGDIGIAKITPCFENGKSCVFRNLTNGIGAGTTELHIVRTLDGTIDPRYVLAYFQSPAFLELGESKMTGTAGQKRLPKDFVRYNPFPLPPLAEQHRIVAKVDELMALCDKLEAQQNDSEAAHSLLVKTLLDTLTQTQDADDFAASWVRIKENFHTLFTTEESVDILKQTLLQLAVMGKLVPQDPNDEPASELLKRIQLEGANKESGARQPALRNPVPHQIPGSWTWAKLGQVARKITDGTHHTPVYVPAGVPFLSVKDVSSGFLDFSNTRFISREQHEILSKRCNPKMNDILLTKVGTTGIAVSVDTECEFSIFVSIALIKMPEPVDTRYMTMMLNSPAVREQSTAGTEGVGNKNLVLRKISDFWIPLPPLAEQHRIVAKVDELMALCDELKWDIQASRRLQDQVSSVMLQAAVCGESETADDSRKQRVLSRAQT
ncbi:MAG: restriction endonuclease subunit S [Candidatus Obscuribacter sp.]|nr:restriction endonuclease subunit S [Candidatus Obscuribacter sp.]MBK9281794.1 restriction endonuclease subunit S [Candidatus Obscuribacter sp.]